MSDAQQFEAFMKTHQDMVFGTAVRLLGSPADAEDIAQAVFLKAYERFAEIGASPAAGGWLRTVATNLCLNHLARYRRRWRFFSEIRDVGDEDAGDYAESLAAPEAAPVARREELELALRQLPDAQRVPLVLFHFEGMSYDEIAARIEVSVGKVKTDIHRGRLALKRKLELLNP
jgi:RNA polymerase sigma-70 factor (ECF subfamily)